MTEREFATDVVAKLQAAGQRALFAGGCVRDELLGLPPADYDVATDATPDRVKHLFRRCHGFGASFGVVEVLGPRGPDGEWLKVQVATFRSDGTYTDGRRPDAVTFSSPEEDAKRRDFTINGMFLDPVAGRVIDYVGGQADLAAKVLRAIGRPEERFAEDKLRVLRAVRMAARFDLSVDVETFNAARQIAEQIRVVSAERIAEEFRKILSHPNRGRGVRLFHDFGLGPAILPELGSGSKTWYDRIAVVAALPAPAAFPLAFAALIHELPAATAEAVCKRLKLSNAETDAVTWLVAHRDALRDAPEQPPSRFSPFLAHPGARDLIALHRAVAVAHGEPLAHVEFCEEVLRTKSAGDLNPRPLLTGDDLRAMGMKPGPHFKRILEAVRAAQLDGRVRTAEEARRLAQELA